VFTNTLGPTFIFKEMDINHQSCPPSYKLLNDVSKIASFHFTIHIKIYMLIYLCLDNYAMYDGFTNGTNNILKTSMTYCDKTII
jgi:hypothetical protein